MGKFFDRSSPTERRLRDARPEAPAELVDRLARRAEAAGTGRRRVSPPRLAAAISLSGLVAGLFVGLGGVGYAASAVSQVANAVKAAAGVSTPAAPPSTASAGKTTLCHATGSTTNPYVQITVANSAVPAHQAHVGDLIPAPPSGCPPKLGGGSGNGQYGGKTTICHRTGSATNPYVLLTVSNSALPAHQAHGDLVPAPPTGCPTSGP